MQSNGGQMYHYGVISMACRYFNLYRLNFPLLAVTTGRRELAREPRWFNREQHWFNREQARSYGLLARPLTAGLFFIP